MEDSNVLVAMSSENAILRIKQVLQEQGYNVMCTTTDGLECLRKARTLKLDLTVVEFNIQSITGYEVSKILLEDEICDVILIINEAQEDFAKKLNEEEELVILTKPINKDILINTLGLMTKSRRRAQHLKQQIEGLEEKLETRKLVEKAKGILMKKQGLNEDQAFKLIQQKSMNLRKTMKDTAYTIIKENGMKEDS